MTVSEKTVHGTLRSNYRNNSNPTTEVNSLAAHAAKGGDPSTDNYAFTWKLRGGKEGGGKGYLGGGDKAFTVSTGIDQWMGLRRLTPLECERLQGFPDGWTAVGAERKAVFSEIDSLGGEAEIIDWKTIPMSDTARYKALGNAVAVPVAEWIGRRIMATHRTR